MGTRPGMGLDFHGDLRVNQDAPGHFNTIKTNLDAINTAINACGTAIQALYDDGNRGEIFVGLESAITAIINALDSNYDTALQTHDAALQGIQQIIEVSTKYGTGLQGVH
jgi:hypothetical protein